VNFSDFQDFKFQNFSPNEHDSTSMPGRVTPKSIKQNFGTGLSEFHNLVPTYSNTNNTYVDDVETITAALR